MSMVVGNPSVVKAGVKDPAFVYMIEQKLIAENVKDQEFVNMVVENLVVKNV